MDDEAWKLRLIHTVPMGGSAAGTLWAGYSQTEATAGLSVSAINLLAPLQDFSTETEQYTVGASLNWNITPRMPLQLTYEYINVADREDSMIADPLQNAYLPDFLQAGNVAAVDEDENHVVTASLSYWITPHINVGFTGKLFSNQFVGVTPHYHNPLTAAF